MECGAGTRREARGQPDRACSILGDRVRVRVRVLLDGFWQQLAGISWARLAAACGLELAEKKRQAE
jgi:hypothetical protein